MNNMRYVARIVIEFTTPVIVSSGTEGEISDSVFVSDANGLPAIPGSSLAGVMRSAYESVYGESEANEMFGFQGKNNIGKGSMLSVSWACIHDSKNTPVEGIAEIDMEDSVLIDAKTPGIRDHVKINHLGAADTDENGKFDESPVSVGHRFTFEMELKGSEADKEKWENLKKIIFLGSLRIGGKTRRGFGAFQIVSMKEGIFDLQKKEEFEKYSKHFVALAHKNNLETVSSDIYKSDSHIGEIILELSPEGYWMFGGGDDPKGISDMAPVRWNAVKWNQGIGKIAEKILIPGSAIKGALAHRITFHYNRIKNFFADGKTAEEIKSVAEKNQAVRELFGFVDGDKSKKGCVMIDDILLEKDPESQLVHHVSIDRFTGGARDTALFDERPFWQGDKIKIRILIENREYSEETKEAFKSAIEDLISGRLQLGAGSGRGEGYFSGKKKYNETAEKLLEVK